MFGRSELGGVAGSTKWQSPRWAISATALYHDGGSLKRFHRRALLDSGAIREGVAVASFLSTVPELMDAGLRGARLPRARALALRLGAIAAFLSLWSLLSGAVVMFKLFNPIFLPGPWLVLGNVLDMAVRGQLWVHLAATL